MHQVAHGAREFMHHVRVGDVLALGGDAHGQVVAHQPGHQLGVPVGEAVALTEGDGVVGAQLGVVAAAALGDVVVEPGHVQQLGLGQPVEHLACHREFVALVVVAQAPHVLDHQQGVRVHGVNMEQVVLHHADDAAELGQVLAEDAVAFHAAQLREQRVRAAQQLHEQGGVGRFLAEGVVDQRPRLDQRAHGGGAHAFQVRVLGQQHEHLENRRGLFAEHVRGADFQIIVTHLKTAVERAHLLGLAGAQDHLVEQLQQHLVEHRKRQCHAVEALHQLFHRQVGVGVLVAEAFGELALVIEQQPVFVAAGEAVQLPADPPQRLQALAQHAVLVSGEEAGVDQRFQAVGAEMPLCHPGDHLHVAQATGGVLDVRFQVVFGVVELAVAGGLLFPFGGEEAVVGPHGVRPGEHREIRAHPVVAGQGACFHDIGGHGDVLARQAHALVQGAHAVADFQADVPQKGDEAFQGGAGLRVGGVAEQHHQVHVGVRVQFAAAVAAHRHQGGLVKAVQAEQRPGGDQHPVHQPGAAVHQLGDRRFVKGLVETRLAGLQELPGGEPRLITVAQGVEQRVLAHRRIQVHNGAASATALKTALVQIGFFLTGGEYLVTVGGDRQGMLPLGGQLAVLGDHGPAVGQHLIMGFAGVDHRLDGEHHAFLQLQAGAGLAVMQHLRIFVEHLADTVPAVLAHHGEALGLRQFLDGVADIAQAHAGPHHLDAGQHALAGGVHQPLGQHRGLAHVVHLAGVAVPAVLDDGDVDIKDVALFEHLFLVGNPVADHIIHRCAYRLREAPVAQAGGDGVLLVDDVVVADAVQFLGGDPGLDVLADHFQNFGGQAARFAHFRDVFRGFYGDVHVDQRNSSVFSVLGGKCGGGAVSCIPLFRCPAGALVV